MNWYRAVNSIINNLEDEREDMVIKFINDQKPERLINVRNKMQENVYYYEKPSQHDEFDRYKHRICIPH